MKAIFVLSLADCIPNLVLLVDFVSMLTTRTLIEDCPESGNGLHSQDWKLAPRLNGCRMVYEDECF